MQSKSQKGGHYQVSKYTRLAPIYDDLMNHVNYKKWAEYVLKIIKRNRLGTESLLELACGTGEILHELRNQQNIRGVGLDSSPFMIKEARKKIKKFVPHCLLMTADMKNIPLKKQFDTIICLYDSINYLGSLEEVGMMFNNVLSFLKPGGGFIFDICTERNCLNNFNGNIYSGKSGHFFFVRRSFYVKDTKRQVNDFIITDSRNGKIYKEHHEQIIYSLDEFYSVFENPAINSVKSFKNFTFRNPDNSTDRVHFLVTKS